ncbi:hypothetical protein HN51_061381 [Arachis hypogaea]|uniref:Transcription factor DIVARICATA n=1 Tax=Arachis hypogaea TaxID=3818 RepID=A0A445AMY7_ARAHY|nr:transcription factor DIVARICATA [Arachis ipaensis]XP_025626611.1 transcription factor DIVARICATA [Arachis hypogaea]RYR27811.1 hypothetical protein Ahy_B01g051874 [Arachis hypogaea]
MKWEVEVLSPSSPYVHHNNTTHWFLGDNNIINNNNNNNNRSSTKWTHEENKLFENALALHDKDTPDRWHRVAEMIPGKTVLDVMKQYHELLADVSDIENGLVPIPGYSTSTTTTTSPFTLDWVNNNCSGYDGFKGIGAAAKRSSKTPEQERKKGVPWTEEEHKLFLLGLKKYGKGDWRNISRNFVITRTPTQVASHAQKYFIRQLSGGKDKRRASIHDITTVNLTDNNNRTLANPSSEDSSKRSTSPQHHHSMVFSNSNPIGKFQWNNNINNDNDDTKSNSGGGVSTMRFNNDDEAFMSHHYGVNSSYGFKMQGQNMHKSALNQSSYLALQTQNIAFQM